MSAERWLFIRFRAIGDVLMAQWPITAVHQARPTAELWLASEQGFASGVQCPGMIHGVYALPRGRWKKARWSPQTWREQLAAYTRLRAVGFDYGVDFQGHSKTALLLRLSGAKKRIQTQATDALSKRLNPLATLTKVHKVEQYLETIQALGEFQLPERPFMADPPRVERAGQGPFVTITTGASSPDKHIPKELLTQLCASLQTQSITPILIGGPQDPSYEDLPAESLVGRTSILESYTLVRDSLVHISADTSTGHAAAAYGTRFVTVFQSLRNPPERFRPYSDAGTVLVQPSEDEFLRAVQENLDLSRSMGVSK